MLARPRLVRRDDDIGYLMRVLRNTFISQQRTLARRPRGAGTTPEDAELADPRTAGQPEPASEAHEVYRAISELSDEFRDVLVAVDVVGLSYAEAARALRLPEGTVTSRLYRARQQVVRRLEPPGS